VVGKGRRRAIGPFAPESKKFFHAESDSSNGMITGGGSARQPGLRDPQE
jgi:hypothetical protein